jgi:hypothetical protein
VPGKQGEQQRDPDVHGDVVTGDMDELVTKDEPQRFSLCRLGLRSRHDDGGVQDTRRERNAHLVRDEQRRSGQTQGLRLTRQQLT